MSPQQPSFQGFGFLQKVKYGGAVGKKTVVVCVMLIFLSFAVLAMWGQVYAVMAIVAVGLFVFCFSFRSIDKTVKDHPELALMDGAEIVRIHELTMAAKGKSEVPVTRPVHGKSPDLLLHSEEPKT